jgi:hypothetical protein
MDICVLTTYIFHLIYGFDCFTLLCNSFIISHGYNTATNKLNRRIPGVPTVVESIHPCVCMCGLMTQVTCSLMTWQLYLCVCVFFVLGGGGGQGI